MIQGAVHSVHFVGIGGTGMCGLAEILLTLDYRVSGCDLAASTPALERLSRLGARIHTGHDAAHVAGQDLLVVSSAIAPDNPELQEARRLRIPVERRGQLLAEIMRLKYSVAVAGAHGKTTTTSLIGHLLFDAGLDPTVVVGGRVRSLASNARMGAGDVFVAEADESDGSFLEILPTVAVVTNIDREHLDHYANLDEIREVFVRFMCSVPFYGVVVMCTDDPHLRELRPQINRPVLTYGENERCRIRGVDIRQTGRQSAFRILAGDRDLGEFTLPLPGRHNVRNAIGAAAVALFLGVRPERIRRAMASFEGVGRRFEIRSESGAITHLDDYGHHPTEIRAVMETAREVFAGRRLVVLFQPHRYSRTAALTEEFGPVFKAADVVALTDIYAAGETAVEGLTGEVLRDPIVKGSGVDVIYLPRRDDVLARMGGILRAGDVLITLGAGPVWEWGDAVMERLASRTAAVRVDES